MTCWTIAGSRMPATPGVRSSLRFGVVRLHDPRLESDVVNGLHERLGRHDVRTVLHVRPLVIVGHGGGKDPLHLQKGLAHGQGTSPSCHALDEERHDGDSRLLVLARRGGFTAPE